MTRDELEQQWANLYGEMCRYAERRMGDLGQDIVHLAYLHMIENETYRKQPVERARLWIWWKVRRDLVRVAKREQKQDQLKGEVLIRYIGGEEIE